MKAWHKFLLTAAFISAPWPALASPGWSAPLTINSLISVDQSVTIVVSGNDNPVGCPTASWLRLLPSDSNFSATASTVLTAFSQGKQIKAWELECEADGSVHFNGVRIDR